MGVSRGIRDRIKEKLLNFRALTSMNRRQRWFIYPEIQFKIILYCVSIVGLALSVTCLAIQEYFVEFQVLLIKSGYSVEHPFFAFLSQQRQTLAWLYLGIAGLSIVIGTVLGALISHRIVGPMLRMHRHLLDIVRDQQGSKQGPRGRVERLGRSAQQSESPPHSDVEAEVEAKRGYKKIQFRKKDYFQSLASEYNLALQALESRDQKGAGNQDSRQEDSRNSADDPGEHESVPALNRKIS